ncbi:LexA family protein [Alicyclobacillus dauci]|uniref:Peptidase S24/S26A/S26B/S26C domain-containing protein n=1 Tax=Alicyclobacillus dauci TaxID=1475485 RepID=A0ABY6Z6D6_9BACL|nr:S24 family peptidase [Alicyclobacillus dauci]WAH38233.1 hypothetical protein NZD86_07060 [Alicyclobacillus dauci]
MQGQTVQRVSKQLLDEVVKSYGLQEGIVFSNPKDAFYDRIDKLPWDEKFKIAHTVMNPLPRFMIGQRGDAGYAIDSMLFLAQTRIRLSKATEEDEDKERENLESEMLQRMAQELEKRHGTVDFNINYIDSYSTPNNDDLEVRDQWNKAKERSTSKIAEFLSKMKTEDTQHMTSVVNIPVLGSIKAGYDLYAEQQVIDYKPVAKSEVADGEYFYLQVKGDSMIGDRIQEGDRVLVRRQDWVEDGKIAVVLLNGDEATLKRVFYQDDTLILQSSNPNYPPRIVPVSEARIQGQVTQVVWDV